MWLITTRFIFAFGILLIIICDVCGISEKLWAQNYLSSEIAEQYATSTTKYSEEEYKKQLNPIEISDEDIAEFPVKQKRCSNLKDPNPESTTDLRKRLEQQRLEIICKFCNTSELRMKTPMCKRCVPTNELLGNAKQKTSRNKTEEFPLDQPNKSENSENPKEFQYKSNNRDEKKINYDTPVHINKTEEKLKKIDIPDGLNSPKTNSTLAKSTYKLLNPPFLHIPPQTISENLPQSTETKIWKLKENNPENARVLWKNIDEKINNFNERTALPMNLISWNSNIGMSNKKSENEENINYEQYSPKSTLSNSHIFKTSDTNSQKIITNEQLTKSNELLNKKRKEMPERGLDLIAHKNTNKTNKYTEKATPLIISKNKNSLLTHSQIDILNTLQDMLNTSKEEERNHPGEDENSVLPIQLYGSKNVETGYNLKSPSETTEKMDSVQTPQNIVLATNDDDYKNAMINKIHDLFSQYLNMEPQIDSSKYQNFQIPLPPLTQEESEKRLMDEQVIKTKTKSKNFNNENNSILNNNENVQNAPDIELSSENVKNMQNNHNLQLEKGKIKDIYTKNCDSDSQLQFTEEKIKLPLILRQNGDGTVQLLLDKSEMCNSFNEITESNKSDEKNKCKRKTDNEDNLLKRSFNIIDQLNHDANIPNKQTELTESDVDNDVKENFYKHLINKQLKELFHSLNVEIDNSEELHTYIDDLSTDEKDQLKQYLLSSITDLYTNDLNKSMLQKEHEKYTKTLLQNNRNTHIINDKNQEEENRVYFPMQSEDNNISLKHCLNSDKLIPLIRAVVHSELQNSNLCPICSQSKCTCTNQNNNLLNPISFSSENIDRVINKRQNNYDYDSNDSGDVSPHGIVKRRYKIFNNILNWARGIITHNNTKTIE